jgi:tRNA-2-methylthio-N6-dimethylallyladenosine synthase
MNDRDSEIMTQLLSESYQPTHDLKDADIILVNTCSIREKAEQKAFSLLGSIRVLKKKNKSLIVAVVGCVAQQEGRKILARMPFVDLVVGPQNIYNLPMLIEEVATENKRIVSVEQSASYVIPSFLPDISNGPPHKRFVTIMQGCNNFCTYCVVPFTRGREISRKFDDIIAEVEHLVKNGVKEITLLGQNVNSYGRDFADKKPNFSELLRSVAKIDGLERLRFTTSNPRDLTEELTRCFADLDVLCSHFHLPVQSGSDSILGKMNRHYTQQSYLEQVDLLRQYRPDISLTTDIIVGFPGETDADFEQTMNLIEKVRYQGAYSFKYSDRPQAKSVEFADKIPEAEKSRRLAILQKRIDEITRLRNNEFVGKTEIVMVEGHNKDDVNRWNGRTGSNHIVHFQSMQRYQPGQMVSVVITKAMKHSLQGTVHEKSE